jgi:hypothetical protein
MALWVAIGIAIACGLSTPFGKRLHATGLWAGKAISPPDSAALLPNGMQDAVTDGWPSTVSLFVSIGPFIAAIVGFIHAWWAGLLAFAICFIVAGIAGRFGVAASSVDRYLLQLLAHAQRRYANFVRDNDTMRAEAAEHLTNELESLLDTYLGRHIPAPTFAIASSAPHGDPNYLLRLSAERASAA